MRDEGRLTAELRRLLGEDGLVRLAQQLGGTRVYLHRRALPDDHDIVQAVGRALADKLSDAFAPDTICVPLARRERALHYYAQGLSYAQIARRLGMTEKGVAKLFKRQEDLPERPKKAKSPAQIEMF